MAKQFAIIQDHSSSVTFGTISEATYTDSAEFGYGHDAAGKVDSTNVGKRRVTADILVEFDVANLVDLPDAGATIALDWDNGGPLTFYIEEAVREETNDNTEVDTFRISCFYDYPTP